jgi:hypothetical protein
MACVSYRRDDVEDDAGAAAGAVAAATRTVSPATRVSGGLSMVRSDADRPAMIEAAMIWLRRLDNQPAHAWLRDVVIRVTRNFLNI